MRGFEIVTAYRDREINLPKRATNQAAGYDFEAAEDVVIPSAWKVIWRAVVAQVKKILCRLQQPAIAIYQMDGKQCCDQYWYRRTLKRICNLTSTYN